MRDLSKQILPTLYTKLGSKDGRNKYLPVVTCKQIRTFIKDQLLIGKTDLKKEIYGNQSRKCYLHQPHLLLKPIQHSYVKIKFMITKSKYI